MSLSPEERTEGREFLQAFMTEKTAPEHALVSLLKEAVAAVTLSAEEKEAVGARIGSYVSAVPLEDRVIAMPEEDAHSASRIFQVASFFSLRKIPAMAGVVLCCAGGTAFAASASESALPGDALYPVKLYIAENAYLHLRFAPAALADWEATRAERRLEEAETLAARGQLTVETHDALAEDFALHAERARAYKSQSSEDSGAAMELEESLAQHETVLRRLVETRGEGEAQLRVILDRVEQAKRQAVQPSPSSPSNGDATSPTAETRDDAQHQIDAAHRRIEQSRIYLLDQKNSVRPETMAAAQDRLNLSSITLAQANAKLAGGHFHEALGLAKKASLLAQEAKLIVRAEGELKIDLLEPLPGGIFEDASSSSVTSAVSSKDTEAMLRKRIPADALPAELVPTL